MKAHLDTLGPVDVEPVSVGIFLKRPGRIAQLRPKEGWVDLSLSLGHVVQDRRIIRKPIAHGGRWWHAIRLVGPEDVDEDVCAWLTEAYFAAPE